MHLYHAAVYTSNFGINGSNVYARLNENERQMHTLEHVLESYHYVWNDRYVNKIRGDAKRVFLDSGAFSAFSLGAKVDLGAYCDYIHKNSDIILAASVLDAIGDHDGTWRNQIAMEERGVTPLPCYHYGEPTEVLDWYVKTYPYITIGGMVPVSTQQLIIWLDRIWSEHLVDSEGKPKVKVHGFGLTSLPLMLRYPWYSVDSSTWQAWGSFGQILLPENHAGQIQISDKSSFRKNEGQHFDNFAPVQREALTREIERHGFEIDRLRTLYPSRWAWNMWAFPRYAELRMKEKLLVAKEMRLF